MQEKNIEPNQTPGDEDMADAYKLSAMLTRDRLGKESKENLEILDEINEADVIVVDGTYDHIHLVLEAMDMPFKRVTHYQLEQLTLRPDQTVFVNCASSFPDTAARKLSTFVIEGGQLITTDWALKNVLEVGFPGYVRYNGRATADEVIRIEIMDRDNPILKGFLDDEVDAQWWLEGSSYPMEILAKEKVNVLMRSKELKDKYGEEPVIIHFKHGDGEVYHMISHFYLQRSETRDAKHTAKSMDYASTKGASLETMAAFEEIQEANPSLNYGKVQSASTNQEFISRAILNQKKKFMKKTKKSKGVEPEKE